jgi:hypothetical protein
MNMKKLSFLLVLLLSLSFVSMAQVDDEETNMFGSKRGLGSLTTNIYDFGTISTEIVEHEFIIKNAENTDLTITGFDIPEGIGIVVVDNVVNANSEGKFIVTVNKEYITTGDFEKTIIVKTETLTSTGVLVTKETAYVLKGKIQ